MPKFLIERHIPGAGNLLPHELNAMSATSSSVLRRMGPHIQWVESYVTYDRLYCLYIAQDEAAIKEHARLGGFPVNRISEIKSVLDPTPSEP